MINSNSTASINPNRRAQRSYHCYACQNEWRQLVNPSDLTGVRCPACSSDFFEESQSFQELAARPATAQPVAQPQIVEPQAQNLQLPPQVPQRRQETMHVSPDGSWQRSVTISFGPDGNQTQVTSVNMGGIQSARAPQAAADPSMNGFLGSDQNEGMDSFFGRPNDFFTRNMFSRDSAFGAFLSRARQQQQAQSHQGCSSDYIKNLPQKEEGREVDCYICLEKCSDGETSCQLPCNHAFDRSCIETWLKEHDSCPVCRTKLDQGNAQMPPQQQPEPRQQRPFQQHRAHHQSHAHMPSMNNFFFF